MRLFSRMALLMCTLLLMMTQAFAADLRTFVVLPFNVNGSAAFNYLEKAIPPMVASRLYWRDNFQSVPDTVASKLAYPANEKAVQSILDETGATYAIWGDVTIIGDEASLDVRTRDAEGKEWRKGFKTDVNDLIATLQSTVDSINNEVFGRPLASGSTMPKQINRLNPGLVHNETTRSSVYLNPQFRYQGAEGSRMRSQALPFATSGMAVADVTGEGKNSVVLLEENTVHIYQWGDQGLAPKLKYKLPASYDALTIRTIDLDRDGAEEIIISLIDPDSTIALSLILSAQGGKAITEVLRQRGIFLSVVRVLPDLSPRFVGQRSDTQRIFSRNGVFEMMKQGDTLVQGGEIRLPKGANIFNFAWLPSSTAEDDKLIMLNNQEKLVTFNAKGRELTISDENYSGSAIYIDEQMNMPGLGKSTDEILSQYFMPMRMLVTDLDNDGVWELLVNKPISFAAMFFERYRFFPEGEIQALTWDGLGLSLLWKTRRIKGSVADFVIGDINNDGITDLIVCVNTHPGALNIKQRKSIIIAYPLDSSKNDPNTSIITKN